MVAASLSQVSLPAPRPARLQSAVSLRPLRISDALRIRRWMADPDLIRFTVLVPGPDYTPARPFTRQEADRYLERMLEAPDGRAYAIMCDGVHVGNVGLKAIDLRSRSAECFIEIGESSARGHGVGTQAMRLLIEYAFRNLHLAEVRLGVFEFNTRAIQMYRQLGFRLGPQYGWHFAGGLYYEVLGMILEREAYKS